MKKMFKMVIMAIPALAVALAVGATTMGCGDTSTATDMPVTPAQDMAVAQDLAKTHD